MSKPQNVSEWLSERGLTFDDLQRSSQIERKVLEAIVVGRYTSSPQQRQRIASALGVAAEDVAWGQGIEVQHLYGHGPQFGRTP